MNRYLFSSIVLLVALSTSTAQEVEIDLRRNIAEDVLITVTRNEQRTYKGTTNEGETVDETYKTKSSLEVVDVYDSTDLPITARRLYVEERVTTDKVIADKGLDGAEFTYKIDANGQRSCNLSRGRVIELTRAATEWLRADSLSGWLPLKAKIAVGGSLKIDMLPLMYDLIDDVDLQGTALATLTLRSVDEKTGIAEFEGEVVAKFRTKLEVLKLSSLWTFKCNMSLDLKRQQISAIDLKGTGEVTDEESEGITQSVELESKWRSVVGPAAAKARRKKTTFRMVPRVINEHALGFDLPSHYSNYGRAIQLGDGVQGFMSILEGVNSSHRVGGTVIPSKEDPAAVIAKTMEYLLAKQPTGKTEKLSSKAGKGSTFTLTTKDAVVIQDYIAGKEKVILLIYSAGPGELKELMKEIKQVRKTIEDLSL